ncbi:hypothetical protein HK405_005896, partial [Cladochytrium tenue]
MGTVIRAVTAIVIAAAALLAAPHLLVLDGGGAGGLLPAPFRHGDPAAAWAGAPSSMLGAPAASLLAVATEPHERLFQ